MKVLIVGYGNMGKEVEKILLRRNHSITARVDNSADRADVTEITDALCRDSDVVIEFSLPDAVRDHIALYTKHNLPAVIGTTGWGHQQQEIKTMVENSGTSLLWSPNFSMGAQLFLRIVESASKFIDAVPDYDILMYEIHHSNKKDSPSGTALKIGEAILRQIKRKTDITTDRLDRKVKKEELHIGSVRGGSVPGTHSVLFDSVADTIELKHTARNRGGFALGAVMAAEWVRDKSGFFTMEDFLNEIL
jgi:4-hydroxy-tetrahydrodipicolinate reductase